MRGFVNREEGRKDIEGAGREREKEKESGSVGSKARTGRRSKSLPMVVSLFRKGKMFFPEMESE